MTNDARKVWKGLLQIAGISFVVGTILLVLGVIEDVATAYIVGVAATYVGTYVFGYVRDKEK